MSDFEAAVKMAKHLVESCKMQKWDACRFASWEYDVDCDKIFRAITD